MKLAVPPPAPFLRHLAAAFAALALLSGSVARAQDGPLDDLPPEYEDGTDYRAWFSDLEKVVDPRWPDSVVERYASELSRGRHGEVLRALSDEFRQVQWPTHNDLTARFQRRMDAVADAFAAARAEAGAKDALETREQRDALLRGLEARRIGVQSLLPEMFRPEGGGPADLVLVFFAGTLADEADTSEMIQTYRVDADGKFELLVPRELMRDLRLRAESVRRVLQDFVEPAQKRAFDRIVRADAQWTNYLRNGYSQYPWESYVNGKLWDFSAFDPPDQQLILLHPTIGFELSTASLDEITADEVINVELLGYVGYYGDENEHFLGGSIAAALRNDAEPGLGVVVHWNRSFSAGIAWHDVDGGDDAFVYLSFDLFRFLQTEGPRYKAEYDRVRALLPR